MHLFAPQVEQAGGQQEQQQGGCSGAFPSGAAAAVDVTLGDLIIVNTLAVEPALSLFAFFAESAVAAAPTIDSGIVVPNDVGLGAIAYPLFGMALILGPALTAAPATAIITTLLVLAVGLAAEADSSGTTDHLLTADAAAPATTVVAAFLAEATGNAILDALSG